MYRPPFLNMYRPTSCRYRYKMHQLFTLLFDSFVALLEYAETDLRVSHVVVRLTKTQPDLSAVVRLFMFFGFTPLPPTHALMSLIKCEGCVCLAYDASSN